MNVDIAERRGQKSSKGIVCFGFVWYGFFFWLLFCFVLRVLFIPALCVFCFGRMFACFLVSLVSDNWILKLFMMCPALSNGSPNMLHHRGLIHFFKRFWWPRNNPWIVLDCSLLLHHSSLIFSCSSFVLPRRMNRSKEPCMILGGKTNLWHRVVPHS